MPLVGVMVCKTFALQNSEWIKERKKYKPYYLKLHLYWNLNTQVEEIYIKEYDLHDIMYMSENCFSVLHKILAWLAAPNPSQHQSIFQWVNSLHEVAKGLEFQL